jgi:hypothetical protein
MLLVRKRVPPGSDQAENRTLSLLTQEVWATGTRLRNALRFEAHFRQFSKEHEHDGVPGQGDASRKLSERAEEDYLAAMDRLLEALLEAANQPTLASQRERRLPLGL